MLHLHFAVLVHICQVGNSVIDKCLDSPLSSTACVNYSTTTIEENAISNAPDLLVPIEVFTTVLKKEALTLLIDRSCGLSLFVGGGKATGPDNVRT